MQEVDIIRGQLSDDDSVHLERATEMGRFACVEDDDFLKLASQGVEYASIIKGVQRTHSIGDWIRFLRFVHALSNVEEMRNKVTHLFRVD